MVLNLSTKHTGKVRPVFTHDARRASKLVARIGGSALRRIAMLVAAIGLFCASGTDAQIATGSYTGNNTNNRPITGVGFQPDVVIIKRNTTQYATVRTSTMVGDASKQPALATALATNMIKSLDADGFTLGTHASVNAASPALHYWTAFKAIPGSLAVGTYTGNGTSQNVTGIGFDPDMVWVISSTNQVGHSRMTGMTASYPFSAAAGSATAITGLITDGFSVGNAATANATGITFHYIAWKAKPGRLVIGSYTGNNTDSRSITGVGFQPQYLVVQNAQSDGMIAKSSALGGDAHLDFANVTPAVNFIQALETDGFQVGTAVDANRNAVAHYYAAWAESAIFISNATGNWGTSGTWTRQAGTDADGVPDGNDSAFIQSAHTVTLAAAATQYNTGISGTLTAGSNTLGGVGAVVLNSGATLRTAHTSGVNGTLAATGTKTLSTGANFEFNGSMTQATGTMMPAQVNNLTINNAAGVTLTQSTSVNGTFTMTVGNLTTNANILTIGTSTASLGTLSRTSGTVVGNVRRWFAAGTVANVIFPVGTSSYYRPATIHFTTGLTGGGTLLGFFTANDPGTNGLSILDGAVTISQLAKEGFWTLTTGDGLSGGAYTLDLQATAFAGVNDYTTLRVVKRANGSSPWTVNGTHAAGTGSNLIPIAHRTGMSGFSDFAIGGGTDNPLPIELARFDLSLDGRAVRLEWATASEVDNAGFEIQRMAPDETTWRPIASHLSDPSLAGLGTSPVGRSYRYIDGAGEPLAPGVYGYRLVDVATDGARTEHPARTIAVQSGVQTLGVSTELLPNPSNGAAALIVRLDESRTVRVELVDALGEKVATIGDVTMSAGPNRIALPTEALSNGRYFVRLTFDGRTIVRALEHRH